MTSHPLDGAPAREPSNRVSLFYVIDIGSTGSRGGAPWGVPVFTLHLNSDAGYADLPLTLLGAPVSIGEARGDVLWPKPRLYCLSPSPGTGPHVPVRHNRGSSAIQSNRAPW